MTLDASSYFDHIKAYISDEYIVHSTVLEQALKRGVVRVALGC